MKKFFIFSFSLLLIVGLSSIVLVNAQDNKDVKKETIQNNQQIQNQERGRNFVDKDKDGICDNNKMGTGQRTGRMNNNRGINFVDKNKDGQCDNLPNGKMNNRSRSVGPNFVDKNNDGICDNRPHEMKKGMGRKYGNCDGTHRSWRGRR
ncbi:MAG: hypothetical protein M1419_09365 [Bacteroidetes bacterium]|nr:hypothetical protein [Bacteroidota bacterium]